MCDNDTYPCPNENDVKQRLIAAVCVLYRHDWQLLENNANERSITHKLAEYLQREFPDWHVDCEYNRRGYDNKKLLTAFKSDDDQPDDIEAKTVFPDIIVHRRNTCQNLLVLEIKKVNGKTNTRDCEKLKGFTDSNQQSLYQYTYGVFLKLGNCEVSEADIYQNGEKRDKNWVDDFRRALRSLGISA